jgi:hypothetical protein
MGQPTPSSLPPALTARRMGFSASSTPASRNP